MSEKFEVGDIIGIPKLSSELIEIIGFETDGRIFALTHNARFLGKRWFTPDPDTWTKIVPARNATKRLR